MKYSDLKACNEWKENRVPQSGQCLAYTRNKVFFEQYSSLDMLENLLGEREILEIHLFDETTEFRCVMTKSNRFSDGKISCIEDFSENDKDSKTDEKTVYVETCVLKGSGTIKVLNHIAYDEKNPGMTMIDGYRLKMEV